MRKLHIGTSPLTNRIFAGHVLKDGRTWGEGKQDVTGPACGAVIENVLANGGFVNDRTGCTTPMPSTAHAGRCGSFRAWG